jgi:hypothetical protein
MKLKLLILSFFLVFSFAAKSQSPAVYGKTSASFYTYQHSSLNSIGLEITGEGRFTVAPRFGLSHLYTNIVYSGTFETHYLGFEGGLKFGFRGKNSRYYSGLDLAVYYGNGITRTRGEFVFAPTIFVSGPSIFEKVDIGANMGSAYSLDAEGFGLTASLFLAYRFL